MLGFRVYYHFNLGRSNNTLSVFSRDECFRKFTFHHLRNFPNHYLNCCSPMTLSSIIILNHYLNCCSPMTDSKGRIFIDRDGALFRCEKLSFLSLSLMQKRKPSWRNSRKAMDKFPSSIAHRPCPCLWDYSARKASLRRMPLEHKAELPRYILDYLRNERLLLPDNFQVWPSKYPFKVPSLAFKVPFLAFKVPFLAFKVPFLAFKVCLLAFKIPFFQSTLPSSHLFHLIMFPVSSNVIKVTREFALNWPLWNLRLKFDLLSKIFSRVWQFTFEHFCWFWTVAFLETMLRVEDANLRSHPKSFELSTKFSGIWILE